MLSFEGFLQKIFSKKKEEKLTEEEFGYTYIHGLIFYNTYFDAVAKALPKGSLCFIVGGWVRDRIINRPIGKNIDVDFLVTTSPMEVVKNLKAIVGGSIFQFEKEKTVATLIFEEGEYKYRFDFSYLDISDMPENSDFEEKENFIYQKLKEDLLSRDFTINAIAVNFDDTSGLSASQTVLIDPSGGFKDIQEGIIRPISYENIKKDPVRMIRGYRIASDLDFDVDKDFDRFVRKNVNLLKDSPKERIRDEFLKVINSEDGYKGIRLIKECGILDFITRNSTDDIEILRKVEEVLKKKFI
ncbi:MAG: CCA tRNA nucleotidyltransferase [Hydrogenothermaceae bacterium]|nr:CCA tRNA nucleotidyltransferase [Hydrogenothermaceae bacterium]